MKRLGKRRNIKSKCFTFITSWTLYCYFQKNCYLDHDTMVIYLNVIYFINVALPCVCLCIPHREYLSVFFFVFISLWLFSSLRPNLLDWHFQQNSTAVHIACIANAGINNGHAHAVGWYALNKNRTKRMHCYLKSPSSPQPRL